MMYEIKIADQKPSNQRNMEIFMRTVKLKLEFCNRTDNQSSSHFKLTLFLFTEHGPRYTHAGFHEFILFIFYLSNFQISLHILKPESVYDANLFHKAGKF